MKPLEEPTPSASPSLSRGDLLFSVFVLVALTLLSVGFVAHYSEQSCPVCPEQPIYRLDAPHSSPFAVPDDSEPASSPGSPPEPQTDSLDNPDRQPDPRPAAGTGDDTSSREDDDSTSTEDEEGTGAGDGEMPDFDVSAELESEKDTQEDLAALGDELSKQGGSKSQYVDSRGSEWQRAETCVCSASPEETSATPNKTFWSQYLTYDRNHFNLALMFETGATTLCQGCITPLNDQLTLGNPPPKPWGQKLGYRLNLHSTGPFRSRHTCRRNHSAITVITQVSPDRLPRLSKMSKAWDGPVSACVYVSTFADLRTVGQYLASKDFPCNLDLSVALSYGGLYPTNALRNIALHHAKTSHILYLDVDFVPSPLSLSHIALPALGEKSVLIIPAFEARQRVSDGFIPPVPSNKTALRQLVDEGTIIPFKADRYELGHGRTNFRKWFRTDKSYTISYRDYFEPYFIGEKKLLPLYDERFIHGHVNKVSHCYHVAALEFKFEVVQDGFVVHIPHPELRRLPIWRKYGYTRKAQRGLWKRFRREIQWTVKRMKHRERAKFSRYYAERVNRIH